MNLKRIIYITKVIGIYGTYIYKCLNNLPNINESQGEFNPRGNSKASRKAEQVRSL